MTQKRECGDCTLCCTLLGVRTLDKAPNVTCKHCLDKCTIYPTRPDECKDFNCSWLLGKIPQYFKPNECHVMLSGLQDDIQAQLGKGIEIDREIVVVYVDPNHPTAYKKGMNKILLDELLKRGVELILVKDGEKKLMKWGVIDE